MDYQRAAATSLKMLTAFGKDVTLRAVSAGAYDTDTSAVALTTTDETRKAVFLDFPRVQSGQAVRAGSLIQAGDRRCLLDVNGSAPELSSLVIDSLTTYVIVDIKELNPAGTPVLYDLVVRR